MSMMPMDNDPTGGLLSGLSFNKNYTDSPLFHLGMGLLSVPGRSLDPGAVSWGPGLARGMQSLQQHKMNSGLLAEKQARTKLMQGKAEAERRKLEEAEAQRRAQEQAIQAQVAALPPEEQRKVRGLLDVDPDAGVEYLSNLIAPPGPKSMFDLLMFDEEKWAEIKRREAQIKGQFNPSGTSVNVNMPGLPFDPGTTTGKLTNDYAQLSQLKAQMDEAGQDTKLIDASLAKLREQLETGTSMGAEEVRSTTKLGAVAKIADRFNEIAAEVDSEATLPATGRLGGLITGTQDYFGVASQKESELRAMEAQMRAQLGTALSGAAIPESEWPTYQAQVPSVSDSPSKRKAKVKAYKMMMNDLERSSRKARGKDEVFGTVEGTRVEGEMTDAEIDAKYGVD